jgi:RNA polymerase sigma-B factor
LLAALPARERAILMMRFYGNMTQSDIAERIGISQMHVSRLLTRTLTQLRKGMETG